MALTGAQAALSRPAAVTVHQHSNVGGQDFRAQRALQSPLVDGQLRDSTGVAGMTVHGNHGQGVSAHSSYLIRLSWQIIQRALTKESKLLFYAAAPYLRGNRHRGWAENRLKMCGI